MVSFVLIIIELVLILGLYVTATFSDSFKCDRLIPSSNYCHNFTKVDLDTKWLVGDCLATCELNDECEAIGLLTENETRVQCYIHDPNGDIRLNESAEIFVKKGNFHKYQNRTCQTVTTDTTTSVAVETTTQSCPDGFMTSIGNFPGCYYVSEVMLTWYDAEAHCQNLDPRAHLISLESQQEQSATKDVFASSFPCWTGGKDLYNNNTLYWTGTGERVSTDSDRWLGIYHSWGDCIIIVNRKMMLQNCQLVISFICEINM